MSNQPSGTAQEWNLSVGDAGSGSFFRVAEVPKMRHILLINPSGRYFNCDDEDITDDPEKLQNVIQEIIIARGRYT